MLLLHGAIDRHFPHAENEILHPFVEKKITNNKKKVKYYVINFYINFAHPIFPKHRPFTNFHGQFCPNLFLKNQLVQELCKGKNR